MAKVVLAAVPHVLGWAMGAGPHPRSTLEEARAPAQAASLRWPLGGRLQEAALGY